METTALSVALELRRLLWLAGSTTNTEEKRENTTG